MAPRRRGSEPPRAERGPGREWYHVPKRRLLGHHDFRRRVNTHDRKGEGQWKARHLSRATTSASATHKAPARSAQHQTKSGLSLPHALSGARTLHLEKVENRFAYWATRPPFGGPAPLCAIAGQARRKAVSGTQREGAAPSKQSMWWAGDQREGLVHMQLVTLLPPDFGRRQLIAQARKI